VPMADALATRRITLLLSASVALSRAVGVEREVIAVALMSEVGLPYKSAWKSVAKMITVVK